MEADKIYTGEEVLDLCSKGYVDGNLKCWRFIEEDDRKD